MNKSIL